MNRIEEAYCRQAFLMPSLSISATTPSVNRAMVIAEVRIGEHSPNLAQAANSKPQRPKLISQACGIKLPYPLGLLKETTASGFERPFRYICAWHIMPTAKHTTSNFALRVNQSFTLENPVFSAVDSLSNPKITPRCFQREPGTCPFSHHGKSTPLQGYSPRVSESCHQQSVCGNRESNIHQTHHWHMAPISPNPVLSLFARDAPAEQATRAITFIIEMLNKTHAAQQ